jgi:hypothetical protein
MPTNKLSDKVLVFRFGKAFAKTRVDKFSPKERNIMETKTQEEPAGYPDERERLVRQLHQKSDDIVAPLRTLGQQVSARFHCREQGEPCYDLTFSSLKEDQAKEIVRLLIKQQSPRAGGYYNSFTACRRNIEQSIPV